MSAAAVLVLFAVGASSAAAASPGWRVTSHATAPSTLPLEGTGFVEVDLYNIGAGATTGPVTVTDQLPPGLTFTGVQPVGIFGVEPETGLWTCTGTSLVTCTSTGQIGARSSRFRIPLEVMIAPRGPGTAVNVVSASGGGAAGSAGSSGLLSFGPGLPGFGLDGIEAFASDAEGGTDSRAASHPYEINVAFNINTVQELPGEAARPEPAGGEFRNVTVELPPGIVADPNAVPQCGRQDFDSNHCPASTQIGNDAPSAGVLAKLELPIYNLVPPAGVPAQFAFQILGIKTFLDAEVRSDGDYGITEHVSNVAQREISSNVTTIWGVPGQASHDAERCTGASGSTECGLPGDAEPTPFLRLSTSCGSPQPFTVGINNWRSPATDFQESVFTDSSGAPAILSGCSSLAFDPTISARPTNPAADSATGLNVDLTVPQRSLQEQRESPEAVEESDLKNAVVKLPAGLTVNPSSANGLAACTSAQIGEIGGAAGTHYTNAEPNCPDASKVGSVEVETPLVGHTLPGDVYLAKPFENQFDSLLALYIVVDDPQTGVIIKLPAHVEAEAQTGQLTATVDDNPQLPFEHLHVNFFGGAFAPLRSPATCGRFTTTTDLTPWTSPEGADARPSDSFEVNSGPTPGSSCAPSESGLPNKPSFSAGTLGSQAGAFSPFLLKIARSDGSQQLSSIDTTLPGGLLAKLSGVPYCSDAAIAQAAGRNKPGQGALEQGSPSCPSASQVGTVLVGAGTDPDPYYVTGKAYLAGPYKGAPLSLAVITPAIAGPFDLGSVVVRTALYVNPETTQIHAVSDPFPTILSGIPLDLRSVALTMDKPSFTLNPTDCEPLSVLGTTTSLVGQTAALSNPFQVGGCASLAFKPSLKLSLKGATKRAGVPALKAVLTYPQGSYANIKSVSTVLPPDELIDNAHIGNTCTRVQFNAGAGDGAECPAKSILGHAVAYSPLLEKPLEGTVYLRSNGGERELPDLVAALKGQIDVNLVGFIDSVKKSKTSEVSRIRTRFMNVPDAPVSRFVLQLAGAKHGLLQNSANLCKVKNVATVKMVGQNGKTYDTTPTVANSCHKKSKRKGHKGGGKAHHHRKGPKK